MVNQSLELTYSQPVRLSQVLADSNNALGYSPYSLGAVLTNPKKQDITERLKQQVFSELDNLATVEAVELKSQLEKLTYVAREFISLDQDVVRIKRKQNPMLEGHYHLRVSQMPSTIQVVGLIPRPQSLVLQTGDSVERYLEPLECFNAGDMDRPYIIQPDGEVMHANLSYWHGRHYYTAPGALIYIGFKANPELNNQVAELLRYAVKNNE